MHKKCKNCNNPLRLRHHKFCSQKCYWKTLEGIKGENAPNYRKIVGKGQVHKWLDIHYGKPKICEGKDCRKIATWFDWALKRGCKYERKRENFFRLCRSCHWRYDMTEEKKKRLIEISWWKRGKKCPGVPNFKKGIFYGNRFTK